MNRNKRPALTSPWKIGFLVSLLLVTVSIAVGFAITRTFGVTWTWIQNAGGAWAFNKDAFLREMLPLVVVVPAVSLIAYFLITGAVRKYKSYLASGQDYNRLVRSIAQIEDLEDDKIKALGDYPELKSFLLKIRYGIVEREKAVRDKEAALKTRGKESPALEQIRTDSGVLVNAIKRGPQDGFKDDLELSSPDLQQVEKAIRRHLLGAAAGPVSMTAPDAGEVLARLREELAGATETMKQMMTEISMETVASQNGAREIEMYLNQLKMVMNDAGNGSAVLDTGNTAGLAARIDQVSAALSALGEETKSTAIKTALQAGAGDNDGTALVRLADDVRDVAGKFNGIAAQYQEIGQLLKAGGQSERAADTGQVGETVEVLSGKVTLWAERAMVLVEKLNAFEQYYLESTAAWETSLGAGFQADPYQNVHDLAIDDAGAEAASRPAGSPVTDQSDVFERQSLHMPNLEPGDANATGVAGIEQEKDLFEEIGGNSEDNLFADIPAADAPEEQAQAPASEAAGQAGTRAHSEAATPSTELFEEMGTSHDQPLPPTPPEAAPEPDDLLRSQVDLSGVEVEGTSLPGIADAESRAVPPVHPSMEIESHRAETKRPAQSETSTPPHDEDPVYDLYELGAVDYEPTVHQNA